MEGKFPEVLKELQEAFELDPIRVHFDPEFEKKLEEEHRKKMQEDPNKKRDPNDFCNNPHQNDKKLLKKIILTFL